MSKVPLSVLFEVEFSLEINTDGDLGISVHGGFKLLDEWSEEIFSVGFSGEQASDPEDIVIVSAEANLAVEARRVAQAPQPTPF